MQMNVIPLKAMKIHPIILALMQSLSEEQKSQIWTTEQEYVNYDIHTPGTQVCVTIKCSHYSFRDSSVSLSANDSRAILNELHIQDLI